MNSKDFGKRVAALRKEKGLTQSELAYILPLVMVSFGALYGI